MEGQKEEPKEYGKRKGIEILRNDKQSLKEIRFCESCKDQEFSEIEMFKKSDMKNSSTNNAKYVEW